MVSAADCTLGPLVLHPWQIFVTGRDGGLHELRKQDGAWWWIGHGSPPGTLLAFEPGAAMPDLDTLYVTTVDGRLFSYEGRGGWSWVDHGRPWGTSVATPPGGCMPGLRKLFVGTGDGRLFERYWDGQRMQWSDHGRPWGTTVATTPGAPHPNLSKLFVGTGDGRLFERYWDGGQWQWSDHGQPWGSLVATAPGAAFPNLSKLFLGTRAGGSGGSLFERYWDGGQWQWSDHGAPPGAVVTTQPGAEFLEQSKVFVGGSNGHLFECFWDGAQWQWSDHGPPPATLVSAGQMTTPVARLPGQDVVFVVTTDNTVVEHAWDGARWQWTDHGSPVLPSLSPAGLVPSDVYPFRHTDLSVVLGAGRDHRLALPGSHQSAAGARVGELRGWLRNLALWPNTLTDDPPDWDCDLEVDPAWTDLLGIDLHQVIRVGNIMRVNESGDGYAAVSRPKINYELMSWHPDLDFSDGRGSTRRVPDPSWHFRDQWPNTDPRQHPGTVWAWDPRRSSDNSVVLTARANDDPSLPEPHYVSISGALVTDDPHWRDFPAGRVWGDDWSAYGIDPKESPHNPSRWSEIHPPDTLVVLGTRVPVWTVRCVAVAAWSGYNWADAKSLSVDILAPGRRPDPNATVGWVESVGPETHLSTIAEGNADRTGADIRPFIRGDGSGGVSVHVKVQAQGGIDTVYGYFKAIYRVYWRTGLASVPLAAFFTGESIYLARLGGYENPSRNSLRPATHRDWAAAQLASVVVDDLVDKYGLQVAQQLRLGGPEAAANFFADGAVRAASYGAPLPVEPDDPSSSTDWAQHREWALRLLRADETSGRSRLAATLENRLRALCLLVSQYRFGLLWLVFASESVVLAKLDGYSSSPRNDPTPSVHFEWASAQAASTVRDDLIDKFNLQFDRQRSLATGDASRLYSAACLRLNALGIDFGSSSANTLDEDVHLGWARTASLQELKDQTAIRVRGLYAQAVYRT